MRADNKTTGLRNAEYFTGPILWWAESVPCCGVELHINAAARGLRRNGFELQLLCENLEASQQKDFFLDETHKHFKRIHLFDPLRIPDNCKREAAGLKLPFRWLDPDFIRSVQEYAAFFLAFKPRVVHIWNADFLHVPLAAVLAGVPTIVVAGQSLAPVSRYPFGFESVNDEYAFEILSFVMSHGSAVMTNNSRAGRHDYATWLNIPENEIVLAPNVFEEASWPDSGTAAGARYRETLGIPAAAPVLGGLFRFEGVKDPELWLNTAVTLCEKYQDLYAVLGGNGILWPVYSDLISRSKLAKRILLPGLVSDVSAFYAMSDVFLLTSHVEGLPNVVLEASYHGLPVVTTKAGGVSDAIINNVTGIIVEQREAYSLAEAAGEFFSDPARAVMAGQLGKTHVVESFSADAFIKPVAAIYAEHNVTERQSLHPVSTSAWGAAGRVATALPPKVSVIMTARNVAPYIEESVQSILDQTFENFEFLIIDDASEDGTADLLRSIHDPRITLAFNKECAGIGKNWNTLLYQAIGEYVAIMDSDDVSSSCRLARQVKLMDKHPSVWVTSGNYYVYETKTNSRWIQKHVQSNDEIRGIMLFGNPIGHPFTMLRANKLREYGIAYDAANYSAPDYELWIRITCQHPEAGFMNLPVPLGTYRVHGKSLSQSRMAEQMEFACNSRKRIIKCLGLEDDLLTMQLHKKLCLWAPIDTQDELLQVFQWADRLRQANESKLIFETRVFNGCLSRQLATAIIRNPDIKMLGEHLLTKYGFARAACSV